jgi:hypothetical protein
MEEPRNLEELRADVEARQENILWEDARQGGRSVDAFLWKGDRNAKPIQRAGLVIFGLMFLLLAVACASIPFQKHFEDGWSIDFFMSFGSLLISLRLFRNACLRPHPPSAAREKGGVP